MSLTAIKNSQQFFDPHTTKGKVKFIIKKARRAKNEVGKRSKLKQLDIIETENGKPDKGNLNKFTFKRTNSQNQLLLPKYHF